MKGERGRGKKIRDNLQAYHCKQAQQALPKCPSVYMNENGGCSLACFGVYLTETYLTFMILMLHLARIFFTVLRPGLFMLPFSSTVIQKVLVIPLEAFLWVTAILQQVLKVFIPF